MAARTRMMKFKDSGSMNRFLLLYMDVFKPYSEATIVQANYVSDGKCRDRKGNITMRSYGHHDENVTNMMRKGYRVYDNERVDIHVEPSDFKTMEGLFKKERVRRNCFVYVFEG